MPDSPTMSKVLYIIVIAHNDNAEALDDTKLHSESKKSNYSQYDLNIPLYVKQTSNTLIFTKPSIVTRYSVM